MAEVPTLDGWGLLGLALLLLGAGFALLRRRRTRAGGLLAMLLLTAGLGVAYATLTPDGDPSGWAAFPPLATDAPPPAAVNLDIGAVFGAIDNGELLLRIDADLNANAPPTAVADPSQHRHAGDLGQPLDPDPGLGPRDPGRRRLHAPRFQDRAEQDLRRQHVVPDVSVHGLWRAT